MTSMLAIGSDHAGYTLKEALKKHLDEREIPYRDYGCDSAESGPDYPDIAAQVAQAVASGQGATQGIICCGSGVGVAISANRFPKVRAVVCTDIYTAEMSRRHNDANVICFGGRVTAPEYATVILEVFLNTPFEGGRHQRRVDKMSHLLQGEQIQC